MFFSTIRSAVMIGWLNFCFFLSQGLYGSPSAWFSGPRACGVRTTLLEFFCLKCDLDIERCFGWFGAF